MARKKALGRGLDALLSDLRSEEEAAPAHTAFVPIDEVRPSPFQPRKHMEEDALSELADSIRQKGLLQPIVVRPRQDHYELIAGERRWRAARLAGLTRVPVLVRDVGDSEAMQVSLIENLQREDLNPLEEAEAYQLLIRDHKLTQQQLADGIGKNRATVANTLRLNQLPDPAKAALRENRISMGHARALLSLQDPKEILRLCNTILKKGLSVRQTEKAAAAALRPPRHAPSKTALQDSAYYADLENELTSLLGTRVRITGRGKSRHLRISVASLEELDRLIEWFRRL